MRNVSLEELHEALVRLSYKDDDIFNSLTSAEKADYVATHFKDTEYYSENWYYGKITLSKLVIAHPDFRQEIVLSKESLYIDQWPAIIKSFDTKWLIPLSVFLNGTLLPIIAREDRRKGLFRVWDGQRRTLSAFSHELPDIAAYYYLDA
jgi:hypothetical protein